MNADRFKLTQLRLLVHEQERKYTPLATKLKWLTEIRRLEEKLGIATPAMPEGFVDGGPDYEKWQLAA